MSFRGALAAVVVVVVGTFALAAGTDGFEAFTAEAARRRAVAKAPRLVPDIGLQDHRGGLFHLSELRGQPVLIEFVYTRCPDICQALGATFQRLRTALRAADMERHVVLLSLSFDPAFDQPEELAAFADRFGGADATWRFARPTERSELAGLLRAAEVIVLPAPDGGFVHNAAIHVIDRDGRLVRILDADALEEALAVVRHHG